MSITRKAMLGVLMAATVSLPAFAQRLNSEATGSPGLNLDYELMLIRPDGKMTVTHLSGQQAQRLMQHAKPISGTMILMTSSGKAWAVDDMKMGNGMMLSEFLTREQKLP